MEEETKEAAKRAAAVRQEERRRSFDAAAGEYDRYRPGYPAALFDSLAARLPPPARVLEVASGTGHATLPLAQRGYQVHCIELGEKLAGYAREKLSAYPNVTIEVGRFEEAKVVPSSADLCVIGSAFHWLRHAQALPLIATALRPDGLLALLWTMQRREPKSTLALASRPIYLQRAPELVAERERESAPSRMLKADPAPGILLGWPDFHRFSREQLIYKRTLTGDEYLGLLNTYSNFLTLDGPVRAALNQELGAMIDREFGGSIELEFMSVMQLARRKLQKTD